MKRLRVLSALLSCLAVLASGAMTVAAAAVPSGAPAPERSMAGEPCSHCDDCDKTPCPMQMPDCLQGHSNAAPALVAVAVELPETRYIEIRWSPGMTPLSGRSPPPDPFPPRA
jgi:hypothetical protein